MATSENDFVITATSTVNPGKARIEPSLSISGGNVDAVISGATITLPFTVTTSIQVKSEGYTLTKTDGIFDSSGCDTVIEKKEITEKSATISTESNSAKKQLSATAPAHVPVVKLPGIKHIIDPVRKGMENNEVATIFISLFGTVRVVWSTQNHSSFVVSFQVLKELAERELQVHPGKGAIYLLNYSTETNQQNPGSISRQLLSLEAITRGNLTLSQGLVVDVRYKL